MGSVLIGIGAALKFSFNNALEGLGWDELLLAIVPLPCVILMLLLQGILLGQGRIVAYNAPHAVLSLASVILLSSLAVLKGLTISTAIVILLAPYVLAVPLYYLLLRNRALVSRLPDLRLARTMIRYSLRVFFAAVLAYFVVRLDLFLVNAYLGPSQAGVYSIAGAIADALFLFPFAVGVNLFARVSRGDAAVTERVFRATAVIYSSMCLAAGLLVAPFISVFFGDAFEASVSLFYLLLPGVFCFGMVTILSYHFAGDGYPIVIVVYWVLAITVNVGLNVAFLQSQGTYFAALNSSLTYFMLLILHLQLFIRRTGSYAILRPSMGDLPRLRGRFVSGA
jgi:O-antigen/teichoic acid export membrane protein